MERVKEKKAIFYIFLRGRERNKPNLVGSPLSRPISEECIAVIMREILKVLFENKAIRDCSLSL